MSDTMQGPPPGNAALPADEPAGGQRRLLMGVVAAAAVLVLGAAVYFLFLSGGGSEEALAPITQGTPAPSNQKDGKDGKAKAEPDKTDPPKYEGRIGRDPFVPLAAEAPIVDTSTEEPLDPAAPADPADPAGPSDPGGNSGGSTPAPPITVPNTPKPDPTTSTPDPEPVTKYRVTVRSVDLADGKATIAVDGKKYTVKIKDNFPNTNTGPFKLTGVGQMPSGKLTASLAFGSDAPAELKVGETEVFEN